MWQWILSLLGSGGGSSPNSSQGTAARTAAMASPQNLDSSLQAPMGSMVSDFQGFGSPNVGQGMVGGIAQPGGGAPQQTPNTTTSLGSVLNVPVGGGGARYADGSQQQSTIGDFLMKLIQQQKGPQQQQQVDFTQPKQSGMQGQENQGAYKWPIFQ